MTLLKITLMILVLLTLSALACNGSVPPADTESPSAGAVPCCCPHADPPHPGADAHTGTYASAPHHAQARAGPRPHRAGRKDGPRYAAADLTADADFCAASNYCVTSNLHAASNLCAATLSATAPAHSGISHSDISHNRSAHGGDHFPDVGTADL